MSASKLTLGGAMIALAVAAMLANQNPGTLTGCAVMVLLLSGLWIATGAFDHD